MTESLPNGPGAMHGLNGPESRPPSPAFDEIDKFDKMYAINPNADRPPSVFDGPKEETKPMHWENVQLDRSHGEPPNPTMEALIARDRRYAEEGPPPSSFDRPRHQETPPPSSI